MKLTNDLLEEIGLWLDVRTAHRLFCCSRALYRRWGLPTFWKKKTEYLIGPGHWPSALCCLPEDAFRAACAKRLSARGKMDRQPIKEKIAGYKAQIERLEGQVSEYKEEIYALRHSWETSKKESEKAVEQARRASGRALFWRSLFRRPQPEFRVFGILTHSIDPVLYPESGSREFAPAMRDNLSKTCLQNGPYVRNLFFIDIKDFSRTFYVWDDAFIAVAPRMGLIPPPFRLYLRACFPDLGDEEGLFRLRAAFCIPFELKFDDERASYGQVTG